MINLLLSSFALSGICSLALSLSLSLLGHRHPLNVSSVENYSASQSHTQIELIFVLAVSILFKLISDQIGSLCLLIYKEIKLTFLFS